MSDSSSSIASKFRFISYKVDEFNYSMDKKLSILSLVQTFNEKNWEINVGIKQPKLFKKDNIYIGGIYCRVTLKYDDKKLMELITGISGMFQPDKELDKNVEEDLVKYQIPTILFPYLRSTVTTFIANSGFGVIIFPLINVVELSQKALKDKEIEVIEQST